MSKSIKILTPPDPEFPDPTLALDDPNGLLAVGGDLSPPYLIAAYQHGIFPWFNEGDPILWWSPDPRAVFFLDKFKISQSLHKILRKKNFIVTFDQDFLAVISACAEPRIKQKGTWITPPIIKAYWKLHQIGIAHSVEVWQEDELMGGVYGVDLGHVFCAESMFSKRTNGSKIALTYLIQRLTEKNYQLLDCQIMNPHLKSLGAEEISREAYLQILSCHSRGSGKSPTTGIAGSLILNPLEGGYT